MQARMGSNYSTGSALFQAFDRVVIQLIRKLFPGTSSSLEGTPQIFNLAGCQTVPEYHDLPIDCCQEEGGEGREADEVCVWLCQW